MTGVPRVYLDSNVFMTAFEKAGAHSNHAWWIFRAIEHGEIIGATSEMTLAELLVKPLEDDAADLASGYEAMIAPGPNFEVLPVTRNVIVSAAGIRARRRTVKLPDAIHLASAVILGCNVFVSDDQRITAPEGVLLLDVNPFTVDDALKRQA